MQHNFNGDRFNVTWTFSVCPVPERNVCAGSCVYCNFGWHCAQFAFAAGCSADPLLWGSGVFGWFSGRAVSLNSGDHNRQETLSLRQASQLSKTVEWHISGMQRKILTSEHTLNWVSWGWRSDWMWLAACCPTKRAASLGHCVCLTYRAYTGGLCADGQLVNTCLFWSQSALCVIERGTACHLSVSVISMQDL